MRTNYQALEKINGQAQIMHRTDYEKQIIKREQ
jgi:hypothetical protein